MKSGKVLLQRAGLVTKGPIFVEKTSRKTSSVYEEDVGLNKQANLPFLVQKTDESLIYENTYKMVPDESQRFSPGMADVYHLQKIR